MMFHPVPLRLCLIALLGSTTVVWAAEEHRHEGHAATELTLNHGKPWSTDAPLRQGMEAIRHDLEASLPRIHAHEFSGAEYVALANRVSAHIEFMVKNCKLPPDVDTQVHRVLEQIIAGVNTMEGKSGQAQGAGMILQALDNYARHFEHPGWSPLNH